MGQKRLRLQHKIIASWNKFFYQIRNFLLGYSFNRHNDIADCSKHVKPSLYDDKSYNESFSKNK